MNEDMNARIPVKREHFIQTGGVQPSFFWTDNLSLKFNKSNKSFFLKLRQTETVDFAGLGRIQNINRTASLIFSTIETPAVAVERVKVPDPAGVIARFLIEITWDDEFIKRAARRLAKCIGHIRRGQSQSKKVAKNKSNEEHDKCWLFSQES
jgi:hypothetical protein